MNLIHDWVARYVETQEDENTVFMVWETVAMIAADKVIRHDAQNLTTYVKVDGLLGHLPARNSFGPLSVVRGISIGGKRSQWQR